MKRLFYLLVFFVLAVPCLPAPAAHAVTYYVDATSGNDLNSGTSATRAWATLAKVNATTFSPGDSVLLKRGGRWSGQLAPRGSGTSVHVITLSAYGAGALPVVAGGGTVSGAVALSNQSYWTIQSLEITNDADAGAVRSGVLIQGVDTVCAGITLQGLYVHDVRGIAAWGIDKWNNAAIRLNLWQSDTKKPTYFENLRVSGCTVRDVHEIAILMLSNSTANNTGVVISGNRIDRTGADGIVLQRATRPRVTGNTVYHCGRLANDFQYIAGIWAMGCESPLFDRNEVAYTAVQVTGGQTFYGDSEALDVDNGCSGTPCVQYNYSHDNGGGFLLVMTNSPAKTIQVRYNVSVNDGRTNCGNNTTLHLGRGGVYVYNNVFFDGAKTGIALSDVADTHYLNNVFQSGGACQYGTLPQFSHNCFFGSPPVAGDADKVAADPQFVRPGSHADGFATCRGYRLKKTSPCRHRGVVIPSNGGYDFFGNRLSQNWCDIGADEASASLSSAAWPR